MASRRILEIADVLEAPTILFQTPKSFEPTDPNLANLRRFLSNAERDGGTMVFQPRGPNWTKEVTQRLTGELDLIHGMDPFLRSPATDGFRYCWLHGRPNSTYNYTYTIDDLEALEEEMSDDEPTWILFNNRTMADDGRALQKRLGVVQAQYTGTSDDAPRVKRSRRGSRGPPSGGSP